jgi:putative methyltransferase (TIGR04325 family)
MGTTMSNPFQRLRIRQIRATSNALSVLNGLPGLKQLTALTGSSRLLSQALIGYRRTFNNLQDAEHCVAKYRFSMQEHPDAVENHLHLSERARPSDYAVLFYLQQILPECRSVLDIGGNAGNLFYCYSQYLNYPENFTWTVYDLPKIAEMGRAIAAQRGELRLHFLGSLAECGPMNIVLISGALHYFTEMPPAFLKQLPAMPQHVFINRTPISRGRSVVSIQDAVSYLAPARTINRDELIGSMQQAGYQLADEWSAPELGLDMPLNPRETVRAYSGMYFRQ